MMFIIAHHCLIASGAVDYYHPVIGPGNMVNAFLVCGVNCFVLISGYFGIRLRAPKLLRFCLLIAVTALFDVLLTLLPLDSQLFNLRYALHKIIPFFADSNWFIPSYIGLMLLSPLINKALDAATPRELGLWTLLLTLLNIYAYLFGVGAIDKAGYTLFQMAYLYVLGRYFRSVGHRVKASAALAAYLLGAIATALLTLVLGGGYSAFAYNSPQVLLASSGLFLLFRSFSFSSRIVNRVARSMFCVFLFHYLIIYNVRWSPYLTTAAAVFAAAFVGGFVIERAASLIWGGVTRFRGA